MKKRPVKTVGALMIVRLGFRRAMTCAGFITSWSMHRNLYGGEATVEMVAEDLGVSRATVFRWQQDFREAFPEFSTPGDLLDALAAAGVIRRDEVALPKAVTTWALP